MSGDTGEATEPGDRPIAGEADHVLLLATRAWAPAPRGGAMESAGPHDATRRLLERLERSWAGRLLRLAEDQAAVPGAIAIDRAEARERLRQVHRAEARINPERVHPTWWARGLAQESPSVRRAVVASAPGSIRGRVQSQLLLDNDDLGSERPASAEVLGWASALWTERLVGGEPNRPDDPPVIVAMTGGSLRAAYRICRLAGEIKLAMAGSGRSRHGRVLAFVATAGPELQSVAQQDVQSSMAAAAKLPPHRLGTRLGLLTFARLLTDCEPFRVRWALQHWPYAIAKLTRSLMPPADRRTPALLHAESEILKGAMSLGPLG